jgi:class 3 adenylate cyclase
MDKDRIQELLRARAEAEKELERMRAPVTILFSDIKGSTAYFERKGDLEGLAMVKRINGLLTPVIESAGGRVVKTIGDGIMAAFHDPVEAVRASIGMQQVLEADRVGRPQEERSHIRVGIHTGLGLVDADDVYGDVVNAASRVQHQAEPDQILITDILLEAASAAGIQCAKVGRAELKGKDEPIDLYAVAWSVSASMQLMEELQNETERKLKEAKRQQDRLEEEFETERDQWRLERRRLLAEIENLEEKMEAAAEGAQQEVLEDLQAGLRFQMEEAVRGKEQAEQELADLRVKWDEERSRLKNQIAALEHASLESLERSNNPTRLALSVRQEVDERLKEARQDWELQWDGERRRLNAEVARLKKIASSGDRKEAAKRNVLEKLGKRQAVPEPAGKTADQWEHEFETEKIKWQTERDELRLKAQRLEREAQQVRSELRREVSEELRNQYEATVAQANLERRKLAEELAIVSAQQKEDQEKFTARIEQLERSVSEAQEATRRQVEAELKSEYEDTIGEVTRLKARSERRLEDASEEWEAERRRLRRQNAILEEQLREAKQEAFKATRSNGFNGRATAVE